MTSSQVLSATRAGDSSAGDRAFEVHVSVSARARRAVRLADDGEPWDCRSMTADAAAALVHPEDSGHVGRMLQWACDPGFEPARLLVRLHRPDGETVSVIATVSAGTGLPELHLDLDEIAVARRAETQLRQIVEGAAQAAVVHVGRRVVYSNPALAPLMGYASLEEMRARGADVDHTHPDDRAMVHSRMAERLAGNGAPERYEFRCLRTDGSVIWVECFATRILWNGEPASLAWLIDITDRKRTEEALRKSEKLFGVVFQASPDMLTLSRRDDGRFIDVNSSFLRVTGLQRDQVVGRTAREVDLFDEPDFARRLAELAGDGEQPPEVVAAIRTRSGEQRQIALSAQIIRFAENELLLSVGRDVTDRRHHEELLLRSKEAAEYANRAKSEFLANMSHELRTPLNAIIGFSEVMSLEMFGPMSTPQYAGYASDIHNSAGHLLQIINDLLDLSKLEAGKQELQESEVHVGSVLEDSLRLVAERASGSQIAIAVRLDAAFPPLHADKRMLKQIVVNLLTNAIKFTPRGGRITIRGTVVTGGSVELAVEDTGIGMSQEDIELALTPFGQVDNALTRRHRGTGLGLPLVRSLAELHGGGLKVESEPGRGTTVTITLPAERVLPRAQQTGAARA